MANVAIITDTHFGARNDSLHMLASMRKFYDNVFFPTLDTYGVRRVLHGGDYVDRRKYVNYHTASFIRNVYREGLRKRHIEEDVIVGNHDCYFRDSTQLNAVRELVEDDETVRCYVHPHELDVDGVGVLLLPWIVDSNRADSMKLIETSKCSIVLGHLELQGFQMFRGMPASTGLDPQLFDRFELVMSGHYHHKSEKGPVHYLGAPYPMIWSDYRDPRGFHIFNTDTKELTFIENPFSLFVRIVYDDAGQSHDYIKQLAGSILAKDSPYHDAYVKIIVKSKNQPYWFDLMMDALYKVNAQDIIVVDDIVVDDNGDESEAPVTDVDTLTLMREYVDSLSITCDKEELFNYLQTKYREALAATQSARFS
jgi:DNA repair exonuclease SbcCD nuclease subunit